MYIDEESWARISPEEVLFALRLSAALNVSWLNDTAYPGDAQKWTEENPSIGQCAVTSLVVQDFTKGDIHGNSDFHHYWNQFPSGAFVDFTHDQFRIEEPIVSLAKVERRELLKGGKQELALTKKRYKVLKKRVRQQMRRLEPTLFLLSSNAEPEYIHDIIESIAIPEGTVHHFRYMARYVDKALRKLIQPQGKSRSTAIIGKKVIIVYLNQKKSSSGEYDWNNLIPIRTGILKDCYKTGGADNSVVHFFFEVHDGLLKTDVFNLGIRKIFGKSYGKAYALVSFDDTSSLITMHNNSDIFETQCDNSRDIGLTFEKGKNKIEYEPPLLVLFEGLYKSSFLRKSVAVAPHTDSTVPKSYYRLVEGVSYHYRFRTYTWEYRKPYQIRLHVPQKLFCTPNEHLLVVKSAYDSECWELIPSFTEQNTNGYMTLKIKSTEINTNRQAGDLIELDWIIPIMFVLKRRMSLRILDTLSDLLFALGPVYIASTKLFENTPQKPPLIDKWPFVLIGIYSVWALVKIARRFITG